MNIEAYNLYPTFSVTDSKTGSLAFAIISIGQDIGPFRSRCAKISFNTKMIDKIVPTVQRPVVLFPSIRQTRRTGIFPCISFTVWNVTFLSGSGCIQAFDFTSGLFTTFMNLNY